MKDFYKKQIELHEQAALYWMAQAAKNMQEGDRATYALALAMDNAAQLQEWLARAENNDVNLDFAAMYKKCLENAKKEVEKDNE